jgi:hypothetical protein
MRRTRDILTSILFVPVWLPLLVIVGIALALMCIPISIQGYFLHRRWKRKLADGGRLGNGGVIASSTTPGTLIVDRPAMGWNSTYLWWTPNDISVETDIPTPTDEDRKQLIVDSGGTIEHPFDRWCYDRFLSADSGTAMLISTRRGERLAKRLQNDASGARLIYTWSAPCLDYDFNAGADNVT